MELQIKPFTQNSFPKKAVLIKSSNPSYWLQEIETMGVNLKYITSYPIPSQIPNVIYGCLLIFPENIPSIINQHQVFQCLENKLYIPENTITYPKITTEEWHNLQHPVLMHPDFGLVELNEPIHWQVLLETTQASYQIIKPAQTKAINYEIKSFQIDVNEEEIKQLLLQENLSEEELKKLPFDMQKVMEGNKTEVEKYLKYLETNPHKAIDLAVPLDVLGTSRGKANGRFSTQKSTGNILQNLKFPIKVLLIIFVCAMFVVKIISNKESKSNTEQLQLLQPSTKKMIIPKPKIDSVINQKPEVTLPKTNVAELQDTLPNVDEQDSIKQNNLKTFALILFLLGGVIGYLLIVENKKTIFGDNNYSGANKALFIVILATMLYFIFNPLIFWFGLVSSIVFITTTISVVLLYLLFNNNTK